MSSLSTLLMLIAAMPSAAETREPIRPGHSEWPSVWATYRQVDSVERDIEDLKAHGVGLISWRARDVEQAREALRRARRTGMKYYISIPEITEHRELVEQAGVTPVPAVMIGGVYRGQAIDRHLFRFAPTRQRIVVEPPVYNQGYAYTRGSGGTGRPKDTERIAHYYPDIGAPCRAEVIVPLRRFDGEQHLKIIEAEITQVAADVQPEHDTIQQLPATDETRRRRLVALSFDLTGLDDALLDHVGIAVYWHYPGTNQYWIFGRGTVSARAESTKQALRVQVRRSLSPWIEANGGRFPVETILAVRFGDECFYITGHLTTGKAVSYPLWDFSATAIEAYRRKAGRLEYPRTWGFPEIYGRDAYGWWLFSLHEGCANLCGIVREEVSRIAPGLLVFRNQTRSGVFALSNDHDGSGQELLTQSLDIVHLDPYPVTGSGYRAVIPRDMSYCGGLARRYNKLLIPWMQAHTYGGPGGLQHVSPPQVARMAREQLAQGVDAVIWLGYGMTFPNKRPDSWERAAQFHRRLAAAPPERPAADLAVLRPYSVRALSHRCGGGQVRNPADWQLQQFLEVWAVRHGRPYDVFELPPGLTAAEQERLDGQLAGYARVVSTQPHADAWVIGQDTMGTTVSTDQAERIQVQFERQLRQRRWLAPLGRR